MRARRVRSLWALIAVALACGRNEPRGACDPAPAPRELGSVCGFENPEDVAFVPTAQLLLVSQMRHAGAGGSLAALALTADGAPSGPAHKLWPPAQPAPASPSPMRAPAGDPGCRLPPTAASFAPHGLAAAPPGRDGAVTVAVVGHGEREAIELFQLRGAGETAALDWLGCVPLPPNAVGNDVWIGAGADLWATNYQPALTGLRGLFYTIAGGLGLATGEVLHWQPAGPGPASGAPGADWQALPGWQAVPGTRGANPNGLLLAPGGATLAVALTGSGSVAIRPLAPGGDPARDVGVGGHPDNLLWSSRASVLVPVHTSGLAFLRCRFGALPCASPWKLMEIDPESGVASERFRHDGSRIGAVASVAEVGKRLYFGSVFDDRIGLLLER